MPGNVILNTANVPEGTCPSWIIERWPELVALLSANLNGALNVFNYGSSVPAPADQGKPWIRLNADGTPDRTYIFSGGVWISKHPVASGLIQLWEGDITTIDTFDGGEAAVISSTTGPMWQQVTELKAKFPLGAGTLPSGAIKLVGNTGGEETHALVANENGPHTHDVKMIEGPTEQGSGVIRARSDETGPFTVVTDTSGKGDAHNTMPPYYTLHFIRRTTRLFYRL